MAGISSQLDFCVLIPCFNNLAGLLASLQSIVYPPEKCCVVVVDDGSREPLSFHISEFAKATPIPVHLVTLPQNQGITLAMNAGLQWIAAHLPVKYIARLDCADICHPDRFTSQVEFLDRHPEVGLLGTWCKFRSPDGLLAYNYTTPTEHADIEKALYFRNVFIHPTVMFRAELVQKTGYYPGELSHVEDYALFVKMARVMQTAILDKFLLTCEINTAGISIKNRQGQLDGRYQIVAEMKGHPLLQALGLLKLKLLKRVPYRFIVRLKDLIQ